MVGEQHKIFNSIIGFNAVNVMNNFFWFEISSKMFFHHQSVFFYATSRWLIGMFSEIRENISKFINMFSTFPIRVVFACHIIMCWLAFLINMETFSRTKSSVSFFYPIRFGIKIFFAYFAFNNHTFSLIKKPLSACLEATVKLLTRTQGLFLEIKKLLLLSDRIILNYVLFVNIKRSA